LGTDGFSVTLAAAKGGVSGSSTSKSVSSSCSGDSTSSSSSSSPMSSICLTIISLQFCGRALAHTSTPVPQSMSKIAQRAAG